MSDKARNPLEEDYVALKKQILDLQAEMQALKESNKRLSTENSKLKKLLGRESTPSQAQSEPQEAEKEAPKPQAEAKQEENGPKLHLVKAWYPKFCPDCGTINPGFKDETVCVDCGMHLGEEENVKKNLKACPNCGASKYRRL